MIVVSLEFHINWDLRDTWMDMKLLCPNPCELRAAQA